MLNKLKRSLLVISATSLVAASVAYVPASSADDSAEVLQLAAVSEGFDAQAKYMASCFACHSTGAAGAPKVQPGTISDWESRLAKGMEVVVANAINGINAMPPKGLCFDCTDDDLRAIIDYMIETSK